MEKKNPKPSQAATPRPACSPSSSGGRCSSHCSATRPSHQFMLPFNHFSHHLVFGLKNKPRELGTNSQHPDFILFSLLPLSSTPSWGNCSIFRCDHITLSDFLSITTTAANREEKKKHHWQQAKLQITEILHA